MIRVGWLLLLLAGCAGTIPSCPAPIASEGSVTLVDRGWHVEIGLDSHDLTGELGVFRDIFPGARAVVFGYGKRTFFTAKAEMLSEYLLGPVPGPAAIQATGLSIPAFDAYAPGQTIVLRLPPDGARDLSDFLWRELAKNDAGLPRSIGPGPFPGSLFYAAAAGYSLANTCNTWIAEALAAAGLPVQSRGTVLSGQVMSRAAKAGACTPVPKT